MTDREKLSALLCEAIDESRRFCNRQKSCKECEYSAFDMRCLESYWVDHLLANGVTVQKHGRWSDEPHIWRCDQCLEWFMLEQGTADMNYCPHCGALMEGE